MTSFLQVSDNSSTRALDGSLNNTTSPITLSGIDTTKFDSVTTGFAVTIWDDETYLDPSDDPNMEKALVTADVIDISGSLTISRPFAKAHTGTPKMALLVMAQHIRDLNTAVNTIETTLPLKANISSLATVATSGSYNDLTNKPTIPTIPVTSVAGKTGAVTLNKSDIGLSNVDNTSDANKPVSTATQTALDAKADDSAVVHKANTETITGAKTFAETTDLAGAKAGKFAGGLGYFLSLPTDGPSALGYGTVGSGEVIAIGRAAGDGQFYNTAMTGDVLLRAGTGKKLLLGTLNGSADATMYVDDSTLNMMGHRVTAVPDPVGDFDVMNKNYGEARLATKVGQSTNNGTNLVYTRLLGIEGTTPVSMAASGNTIARRTSTGQLAATDATSADQAATKNQLDTVAAAKQDTLVSGTNIKTINGNSVLGSGDLVISGGGGGGSGDVVGPSSATDNGIARYDTTTGKLIQNSTITVSDAGSVTFPALSTQSHSPGQLYYDSTEDGLVFHNSDSNLGLNVGEESRYKVRNGTGTDILNGYPVYATGSVTSGFINVGRASNGANLTAQVIGVATEDILAGNTGYITTYGKVRNINTSGLTAGAPAYLGATGVSFTTTIPTSPIAITRVGFVSVVSSTVGEMFVNINAVPTYTTQSATIDPAVSLSNLGLRTAGTAYPLTTSGAVTLSGNIRETPANITATATLTVTSAKNQRVTATGSTAINITLPTTTTAGYRYRFYRTDANAAVVTILGTINGITNYILSAQYKYVDLMSTTVSGTWEIWGNN